MAGVNLDNERDKAEVRQLFRAMRSKYKMVFCGDRRGFACITALHSLPPSTASTQSS